MEQRSPISENDYLQAKRCVAICPHIIGGFSLVAAFGLLTNAVAIAQATIFLYWIIGVVYAALGAVGAEDMVKAWEKGEGRWYRRARDGEIVGE